MKFLGIDHPAVAADNTERLSDWYCKVLGYEQWFHHQFDDPSKSVRILKAPDGTLLEVMPKDDTDRPKRTTWTPGWSHLAIRVENIDSAIEHLDNNHVIWAGALTKAIGGGRVRNLLDPEGNLLQILERHF